MAKESITSEAIINRIIAIDDHFKATASWLHPTLAKLAREREQLVGLANEKFDMHLKHEWR